MVVFRFLFTRRPRGLDRLHASSWIHVPRGAHQSPVWILRLLHGCPRLAGRQPLYCHQHRNVVSVGWFGIPQASRKDEETAEPPHDKTALGDTDGDDARVRQRSTWFNSGTDDVFGLQRASAKAKAALCEHTFECYSALPAAVHAAVQVVHCFFDLLHLFVNDARLCSHIVRLPVQGPRRHGL